jgi:hypothetical protein
MRQYQNNSIDNFRGALNYRLSTAYTDRFKEIEALNGLYFADDPVHFHVSMEMNDESHEDHTR